MSFELDYSEMINLDAEDLAEGGIGEAYERLLPKLKDYVPQPAQILELIDDDAPSYAVQCGAEVFHIYGTESDGDQSDSWGLATYAFFRIVNDQLRESEYRLYAINGGNDLGGMFLTPAQAKAAQLGLPEKSDWPYLPSNEPPMFGMYG